MSRPTVDYSHLPILEKLRQIDSRVQLLNDTVQMAESNYAITPIVWQDLADFVHARIEEAKAELEFQKEGGESLFHRNSERTRSNKGQKIKK